MKRRTFIQSLAAALSMPAAGSLTLSSASAGVPTAIAAVPTKARFWAIYMSSLHGECTPQTLTNLLHIPKVDAKRYIGQLIADGVIKPNPIMERAATELVKSKNENLLDKVKKRSEMKAKAKTEKLEICEAVETEISADEVENSEDIPEEDFETSTEEQLVELETEAAEEETDEAAPNAHSV